MQMRKKNGSPNGNGNAADCATLPQLTNSEAGRRPPEESVAVLMERDPDAYARIVKFLEEGHSPAGVAALTRVPLASVRKIRNLLGESAIHAGIRQVARNLTEASQLMSERLVNESGEIPIHALPTALGVIIDRASLLAGNPTARIEHRSVPTPEDLQKMFNELPKANAAVVTPDPAAGNKIISL
jgi:hypothetical protein